MPYGFPSGEGLKTKVLEVLEDHDIRSIVEKFHAAHVVNRLHEAIANSPLASVDLILERQPGLMLVGKVAMVIPIMMSEKMEMLRGISNDDHWYQYLYRQMDTEKLEDFAKNKLRIATFNYDRSLEQFLFRALVTTYDAQPRFVAEVLQRIPICHLHGSLGQLPQLSKDGGRKYDPTLTIEEVEKCAEKVKIISDVGEHLAAFEMVREWLNDVDQVIFLGFGYHRANIDRLRLLSNGVFMERRKQKHVPVLGAFYGMTPLEQETAVGRLDNTLERNLTRGALLGMRTLQFLREHVSFE